MNLPPLSPAAAFVLSVLGWAALHLLWQGAALGFTTEAALAALRGAAPRVRERVAWLGLAAIALVFAATGVRTAARGIEGGIAMTLEAERVARGVPTASLDRGEQAAVRALVPAPGGPMTAAAPWIGAAWLALSVSLTLGLGAAWRQTRRLRSRATRRAGLEVESLGGSIASRMGITRDVRFLVSPSLDVPAVAGWLSPAVLLPARAVAELPPASLAAVLAHELAHVRRGDAGFRVVQRALRAIFFFHPSVHRLLAAIDHERERACDDLAVAICGSPLRYARALAQLERIRPRLPELAMAADGAPLLARVRRLIEPLPGLSARRIAGVTFAAATAGLVIGWTSVRVAPARDLVPPARAAIAALRDRHRESRTPVEVGDPEHDLQLELRDVHRLRTTDPRAGPRHPHGH